MKKLLCTLLIFALPFITIAQTKLTSLSPAKFYTQSEPTVMSLSINGEELWPNWMSNTLSIQIMHLHFKKGGKDEILMLKSGSNEIETLEFSSADWLTTPGPIEIYVIIDPFEGRSSYRSNSIWLQVENAPKTAPVITDISNHSFKVGEKRENYYIRVYGKNFGEQRSTYVNIGGIGAGVGWEQLEGGVIDVWVPEELINKPGSYPVVVNTKYGQSNPMNLTIEKPVTVAIQPRAIRNNNIQNTLPVMITNRNMQTNKALGEIGFPADKKAKLSVKMIKGVRVTLTGTVPDGPTKSAIENFIYNQENVFVVDNQLQIQEGTPNVNIKLKGANVDRTGLDKLKAAIKNKTDALRLNVPVNSIIIEG